MDHHPPSRFIHRRAPFRLALLITTAATAAAVSLTAPAPAATTAPPAPSSTATSSPNSFSGGAYATRVYNTEGQIVGSGRTAFAPFCASQAGKQSQNQLASITPTQGIEVSGARSSVRSMKTKNGAKTVAVNKIGNVVIGNEAIGSLVIKGVQATSTAQDSGGKYRQHGAAKILSINATLAGAPLPEIELPDTPGQVLTIPGVATLTFLQSKGSATAKRANNNTVGLEVKVLLPIPGLQGETVRLANSAAAIAGPNAGAVLNGSGIAASGSLLNGTVKTGQLANQPVGCFGSQGKWKHNSAAEVTPPGAVLGTEAAVGRAKGLTKPGVNPYAQTSAKIAGVKLPGGLRIRAVESQAKTVRTKVNGKFKYVRTGNSKILGVTANGTNYTEQLNNAAEQGRSVTIPGVAVITPNDVRKTKTSISVIALSIKLLQGTPGQSHVNLAISKAGVVPK